MNTEARRAIEAILMVADEPVEPNLLAQVCEISVAAVEELCDELAAAYERESRGFILARVAGGFRYQSHPECAAYVERFVLDGQSARMSSAALETLSIVAYKQPISRAQVSSIRGVNVDGVMRTLQARGYIDDVGRDPGPGNAVLFGTTPAFLERLGLNSVDDLPALGAFVPGADVVEQLERTLRVSDTAEPADTAPSVDTTTVVELVALDDRVDDAVDQLQLQPQPQPQPGPEVEPQFALPEAEPDDPVAEETTVLRVFRPAAGTFVGSTPGEQPEAHVGSPPATPIATETTPEANPAAGIPADGPSDRGVFDSGVGSPTTTQGDDIDHDAFSREPTSPHETAARESERAGIGALEIGGDPAASGETDRRRDRADDGRTARGGADDETSSSLGESAQIDTES